MTLCQVLGEAGAGPSSLAGQMVDPQEGSEGWGQGTQPSPGAGSECAGMGMCYGKAWSSRLWAGS